MIKRWSIQCMMCEDTDVAHEDETGDMVFLPDIIPLIDSLTLRQGECGSAYKLAMIDAHNNAVCELRGLLVGARGIEPEKLIGEVG